MPTSYHKFYIMYHIVYHCSILRRFLCAGCLETSQCRDTGRTWTNPLHPVQRAPKWRTPFLAWQREQLGLHWLVWPSTWQLSSLVTATQSGDGLDQEYYGNVITVIIIMGKSHKSSEGSSYTTSPLKALKTTIRGGRSIYLLLGWYVNAGENVYLVQTIVILMARILLCIHVNSSNVLQDSHTSITACKCQDTQMMLTKRGIPSVGQTHCWPAVMGTALDRPDAAKSVGNAQPQPREAPRRGRRRRRRRCRR